MELEKLRQVVSEILGVDTDEVLEDTTFTEDLGADSLDIFQIVMRIEEEFSIHFKPEDVKKIRNVREALSLIKQMES